MDQADIDRLRGHDFLPTDISNIPALYATEEEGGSIDDTVIHLRFFTNAGSAFWLVAEYDPETEIGWGYAEVVPGGGEWGAISLRELRELHVVKGGIPIIVERDLHFAPTRFGDIALP